MKYGLEEVSFNETFDLQCMSLIIDLLPGVKRKAYVDLCLNLRELSETVAWDLCFETIVIQCLVQYSTTAINERECSCYCVCLNGCVHSLCTICLLIEALQLFLLILIPQFMHLLTEISSFMSSIIVPTLTKRKILIFLFWF